MLAILLAEVALGRNKNSIGTAAFARTTHSFDMSDTYRAFRFARGSSSAKLALDFKHGCFKVSPFHAATVLVLVQVREVAVRTFKDVDKDE
jgi:hypothetical protein